jgi:hypothetical protein
MGMLLNRSVSAFFSPELPDSKQSTLTKLKDGKIFCLKEETWNKSC